MIGYTNRRAPFILLATLLLACNLVLSLGGPIWLRFAAAYFLSVLLPGLLLGLALWTGHGTQKLAPLERSVFAIGAGYVATTFLSLVISYVPGPFGALQAQLSYTVLCTILLFWIALRPRSSLSNGDLTKQTLPSTADNHHRGGQLLCDIHGLPPMRLQLAATISVIAIAVFLRMPSLGYAEFQNDEVSVLIQATETIQGRSDALFVHDKGPGEILITATIYTLVGRISETLARLPMTVANITALIGLMILGWRMYGAVAGWIAALMMAVDGYFIGFSQIVQYQNLVALMAVLAVLAVVLYSTGRNGSRQLLLLAAWLLSAGVLAHYEAILAAVPIGYLLLSIARVQGRQLDWRGWVLAAATFIALSALFYIPFAAHPRFTRTFTEITANRIGSSFPYNNLADFTSRTLVYSSTYYLAWIAGALVVAWIIVMLRKSRSALMWVMIAAAMLGLTTTLFNSSWLTVQSSDQTWFFFACLLTLAVVFTRHNREEQAVWLWFAVPFIASIFFVQKPRTHVYNFFLPWSLLVGVVAQYGWRLLRKIAPRRFAISVGIAATMVLTLLFGNYQYWLFTHTQVEVLRTWSINRPAGYWFPFDSISQNAIFGFPFKNGWKVVGSLYAQGELDGPLARNGERGVTQWYTRGGLDCARDARYYVYTKWNEPVNKGLTEAIPRPSSEEGYHLIHEVQVNGETRLEIFDRLPTEFPPQVHDSDAYDSYFDKDVSGPDMLQDGPIWNPAMQQSTNLRFGDHIRLIGYSVPQTDVLPGQQLDVALFWHTDSPISTSYKVFNQIINLDNLHKAGQRDGIPGCERYPTDNWPAGQTIADRYSIWIAQGAPPGRYTHLLGMYDDQEERLPIYDNTDQHIGDAVPLYDVNVVNVAP